VGFSSDTLRIGRFVVFIFPCKNKGEVASALASASASALVGSYWLTGGWELKNLCSSCFCSYHLVCYCAMFLTMERVDKDSGGVLP